MIMDLDNFKLVNDRFGHQKGDAVLKKVGKILASGIRDVDYAARYGGEKFVVVMPESAGLEAVEAADRAPPKNRAVIQGCKSTRTSNGGEFRRGGFSCLRRRKQRPDSRGGWSSAVCQAPRPQQGRIF